MANNNGSIDEIIGQEAIKGVDVTTQKMEQLYKVFMQNIVVVNSLNASLGDVKGLKEVSKLIDDLTKATTTTTKAVKDYTQEQANAAIERQRTMNEMKGIARETLETMGAYDKLNAAHKRVQKEAMNVGVALGIESKEFAELTKRANEYQAVLSKVEQKAGNNTRIMGDYRQQLFGLSQVFRELPAFTYSAQTGILGLSNNLPILADGFKQVAAATNEATGKVNGTIGALKIFGASIFSFSNIFAIAIGLFTIFSKEIFAFINGTDKAAESMNELNKAFDSGAQSVTNERVRLDQLYAIATNVNASYQARLDAVNELQRLYPSYLGNLNDEAIMAGKAKDAYMELNAALINKAIYQGLTGQANKIGEQLTPLIIELDKVNEKIEAIGGKKGGTTKDGYFVSGVQSAADKLYLDELEVKAEKLRNRIIPLQREMQNLFRVAGGYANDLTGGGGKTTSPQTTIRTPTTKEDKLTSPTMESLRMMRENLGKFNNQMSEETRLALEKSISQMMSYANEHPIHIEWTWADSLEAFAQQAVKELKKVQEIVSEIGDTITTISSIATDKELASLDQRSKALEEYYNNEIRFIEQSGLSTAKKEQERKKLQAETEAQQKQIDRDRISAIRKQAAIEKAANIANIIMSTAMAIANQLVATPLPAGAIFVASQAALGAAQLAKAIATPLPQYYKGRKGGKAEWAETNEYGAELHVTKEGKAYIPNQGLRGATFLDEGTSVLPADITREIMKSTYVSLADGSKVTTDRMQAAMLAKTDEEIMQLIGLRKDLREKNLSATFNNNTGFEAWKSANNR